MTGATTNLDGPPRRRRSFARDGARAAATLALVAALAATARPALAHEDPGLQLAEIGAAIDAEPGDASLYLRRAELHRLRGEWADGAGDLQKARNLDPSLDVVDLALAKLLLGAGDADPALSAVDRFLGAHAAHAGAHLVRARILVRLDRRAEAGAAFSRGIELALPDAANGKGPQPDDYLDRARNEVARGDDHIDDAIRGLDEGAKALGGAIALELEAIDLEASRRHWDQALARIAAVEARSKRKETWAARRGDLLLQAGREADARRAYLDALAAIDRLPSTLRTSPAVTALASRVRGLLASSPTAGPAATFPSGSAAAGLPTGSPAG